MKFEPLPSFVLLYHRIGSPLVRSKFRGQYVLPAFFRSQLGSLLSHGYRAVSLTELLADPAEAGRFAVTFDDGYTSIGRLAWPILRQLEVSATVFVVAGAIGGTNEWDQKLGDRVEPLLDASEIREMAAAGIEIGSHSLLHSRMTLHAASELKRDLEESKAKLEDLLAKPIAGFSYPYGAWNDAVRAAVVTAGYQYATATGIGVIGPGTDPFAIPRINVRWNTIGPRLLAKIERARKAGEKAHALP